MAILISQSGGCDIGTRPINLHINAFKKLGIKVIEEQGFVSCSSDKIVGANINLDFPSVGATENIIMAACMAEGTTTINNAAMEPEIIDLVAYLNKMGAKIYGEGTNKITINGVSKLCGASHNIMPDRIETGTFLCTVAATGGEILTKGTNHKYLEVILDKLEECGCYIECKKNSIFLGAPKKLKSIEITTMTYPGFPTDMQQIFAAMLLKANGTSIIIENIFENRYRYISELRKMSTKITQDGRATIITGKRKIQSANLSCTDLRGGAALVVASLTARGVSKISNIEYISRGYEKFDYKLANLGAKIRAI